MTQAGSEILSPSEDKTQGMIHGICQLQQLSAAVCYFVPLRPEYSPMNHVLKHHQSAFIPQDQGKISRQNKTSVKLHTYTSSSCFLYIRDGETKCMGIA